jgi:hypothetical protein
MFRHLYLQLILIRLLKSQSLASALSHKNPFYTLSLEDLLQCYTLTYAHVYGAISSRKLGMKNKEKV